MLRAIPDSDLRDTPKSAVPGMEQESAKCPTYYSISDSEPVPFNCVHPCLKIGGREAEIQNNGTAASGSQYTKVKIGWY